MEHLSTIVTTSTE